MPSKPPAADPAVTRRLASNKTGSYAKPAAPKPISEIDKYLGGDDTYQNELRRYNQVMQAFLPDWKRQVSRSNTDFRLAKRDMDQRKVNDMEDMEDDYAGRGILRSGVYGATVGKYNKEFGQNQAELTRKQNIATQDLNVQKTNFERELGLQREASKQAALRRRAQRYGI